MNKDGCIIRLEKADEYRKVETLVREAFWNVYRPGCTEHSASSAAGLWS
ncbi:MAG: hypothetical protein ACTTJ1_08160 [Treponema sp.]